MAARTLITGYHLTEHARGEMVRRQIAESDVAKVLSYPEQTESVRAGRVVYQSRLMIGEPPKMYLLRVFVDIDREPSEIVTVYRSSKIEKYWKEQP